MIRTIFSILMLSFPRRRESSIINFFPASRLRTLKGTNGNDEEKAFFKGLKLITLLLLIISSLPAALPAQASEPKSLTDAQLAGVTGQSGITIYTDGTARITASVLKISDTDSSPVKWLELKNVVVDDGIGGYFSFATPLDYLSTTVVDEPVTLDVGAHATTGQTLVALRDSTHVSPRWYSVGEVVFCDQSLGSLNLDALSLGPTVYRMGAHIDGTSGVDFDYTLSAYAKAFRYTYNASSEALRLSGIRLAGSASGAAEDPSTWSFSGVFRIGDIDGGNPAKIDVGTDTSTGETSLVLSLPMQGSLRVENVTFGDKNFGPIAIDGITVHRMSVSIR